MKTRKFILLFVMLLSLFVVGGQSEAYAQRKVKVSTLSVMNDGKPYTVHTYKWRQRVEDIAEAYGVEESAIYELNPKARRKLRSGDVLLIPIAGFDYSVKEEVEEDTLVVDTVAVEVIPEEIIFGLTAEVPRFRPLQVALLLPFDKGHSSVFVQFYNGVLMALEELTQRGAEISLRVISTDRSVERAEEIVESGELQDVNLIIGPVYGEEFAVVAEYAGSMRVPIISPLGATERVQNPFVVGIAPIEETQWDGMREMVGDTSKNVIVVKHTTLMDSSMMNSLQGSYSPFAQVVEYNGKNTDIDRIGDRLKRKVENIIVVPVDNEIAVEEILSRVSSYNAAGRYDIKVVGSNRWARYTKLNLDLFFKLQVCFPTSYYYDYLDSVVSKVHSRYIANFRSEPSLSSMRGYDVAMLGVGALVERGDQMMYALIGDVYVPLQSPYEFVTMGENGILQNIFWPIVEYKKDYTISVK